ncbi:aminotransferase class IV [Planctomycetaceae bacterium SH139]
MSDPPTASSRSDSSSSADAWRNGRYLSAADVQFPADDIGVLQGVIAVEKLRTWKHACPLLPRHLRRFATTADFLGIGPFPSASEWTAVIEQLLAGALAMPAAKSQAAADETEWGLTLLATPGRLGEAEPTLVALLNPLNLSHYRQLAANGQALIISDVQQPAPACWPRHLKVRSRIHYYLADRQARQVTPGALGVLLDDDGTITETSTSNILILENDSIILPPADRVLPGVIAASLLELMEAAGWSVKREPISPQRLRRADEVWLTGSLVGLWPANSVDGIEKPLSDRLRQWQQRLAAALKTDDK